MNRGLTIIMLALVLLCGAVRSAHAADAGELFAEGQALFDAGDYDKALPLFSSALRESDSPNARLYVARCLRELKRLPEAYEAMKITVRTATERAKTEDRYGPTRDSAAAELALLEPRVGKLIIALAADYPGVAVSVDDADVARDRLGLPLAVNPGELRVRITAPDKVASDEMVTVAGGETKTLAITLRDSTNEPVPVPQPIVPEDNSQGGGVRIAGIAVAGLGVAGLVAFGVTGVLANDRFTQVNEECGGSRCADPSYADVIDEGKQLETIANVSAGLGGALAIAGTLMIILGGPSDEPADDAAGSDARGPIITHVGIAPTASGGLLGVQGHF